MSQTHPDKIPRRFGQPTGVAGLKTPPCCAAIVTMETKDTRKPNIRMAVAIKTTRRAELHVLLRKSLALKISVPRNPARPSVPPRLWRFPLVVAASGAVLMG